MAKNPLFSSYRQGENRVTASMLAVFERIDTGILEQLLGAATGESSLALVDFVNQITGPESVPDASISGNFRFLFEVKTDRNALRGDQIEAHLIQLDGSFAEERLFCVTPDAAEPAAVEEISDERVQWFSFRSVHDAIEDLLGDQSQLISEQTEFLLRELQALLIEDGLLDENDVVVVAARKAYPEYLKYSTYFCQPGRSFREGLSRLAFYRSGAIEIEVPKILHRRDNVEWTPRFANELRSSGDAADQDLADLVERVLRDRFRAEGDTNQVFLLTPHDDDRTLRLQQPIRNAARSRDGRNVAWTQHQRYTSTSVLESNPLTTDDLDAAAR